jgi:hypothetical protein
MASLEVGHKGKVIYWLAWRPVLSNMIFIGLLIGWSQEKLFSTVYLEVGLAAVRWPPPLKWTSVKRREPPYQHWSFYLL